MKNTTDFNRSFRPDSYWEHDDPVSAIVSDLKGEQRRRRVRIGLGEGRDIPDFVLDPLLGEDERRAIGKIHPLYMGGEYLPPDEAGETTIARVSLMSTTGDVIEVRARPTRGGLAYRVVDEYEFDYELPFEHSTWPLTMGKLIELIDGTNGMCNHCGQGLVIPVVRMNYGNGPRPGERLERWEGQARSFATVSSELYLDLGAYYVAAIHEWIEALPWLQELRGKVQSTDSPDGSQDNEELDR